MILLNLCISSHVGDHLVKLLVLKDDLEEDAFHLLLFSTSFVFFVFSLLSMIY